VKAWARARRVPAEEADTLADRWHESRKPAPGAASGLQRRTAIPKLRLALWLTANGLTFARVRVDGPPRLGSRPFTDAMLARRHVEHSVCGM
jgi:hypothetical protein